MSQFRKLALEKISLSAGILCRSTLCSDNVRSSDKDVKGKASETLHEIAKEAGILTDLVQTHYGVQDFKEKFLALPPGPERTKLIEAEVKRRKPFNLVKVTVPGPNGTKVSYWSMPDYLSIDGIRVPLSAAKSEELAHFHNMRLLTSKQSRQLQEKADVKFMPQVLSAGGNIGGRHYSGEEVVAGKIQDSDSAVAYSELAQKAIRNHKGTRTMAHGYMKDIGQATGDPNKTHYYGLYNTNTGKPISSEGQTSHTKDYVGEYGSGSKWIANKAVIEHPDGTVEDTTMDDLQNDPVMYKAIADVQGIKRYNS
jgi:hypothetical protein